LVVKVTPLVLDMLVDSCKLPDSFPAAVTGFLSPCYFPLCPAKFRLCRLVIAGIVDCYPITQDSKACNPYIYADSVAGLGQRRWVGHNHAETGMPLPT
jgi:hypothetical protein